MRLIFAESVGGKGWRKEKKRKLKGWIWGKAKGAEMGHVVQLLRLIQLPRSEVISKKARTCLHSALPMKFNKWMELKIRRKMVEKYRWLERKMFLKMKARHRDRSEGP